MWISTIAFIGAGFVGWGQYSYGEKATAVAKVGTIEISMRELQQSYSRLYNQYNQIFQGNFDEAQAKSMGLQKQAMQQLINQAMILNLAASLKLKTTDNELLHALMQEHAFYKDGRFDKETYQKVLRQNNMNIQEFESDTRKSLLIQKTMALYAPKGVPLESKALEMPFLIADKIQYKILRGSSIKPVMDTQPPLKTTGKRISKRTRQRQLTYWRRSYKRLSPQKPMRMQCGSTMKPIVTK